MKHIVILLSCLFLCSCAKPAEKEIVVSIPADGLWDRYPTPEAVCGLLDTIVWAGFNSVKVDVKPVVGYCEFESSYLEPMRTMKTRPHAHEDWDYAGVFLREGRKRGLKVSLTCAVFPLGAWQLDDGPAFRDSTKDGWFCVEYLPDGLRDIREDRRPGVFCFMNPSHPEVHDFVLGYIEELLRKYKPDGFQLDYCRYNNINCDFSDYSRSAFEQWLGRPVEHFPADIFTFASADPDDIVPGPLYKQWIKWRASVIQGYVREVREIVDRVSPRTALRYWGAGWWQALYTTGQNWCSPGTAEPMDYPWAADDYASTGIADLVDYFELGTYRPRVYGPDDPESMEFDLARARRLVGPDNIVYGSFSSGCDIARAFPFLYEHADGVSFFPVDALRKDPSLWEVFHEAISSSKDKTQLRPANAQSVPVADPFILYEDGIYYLYGTGAANGIAVYVSEDMQSWASAPSLALNKEDSYGNRWFWAPEVYHVGDKYYMYYSAEEHICVATSNSPTGPFVQSDKSPIVPYKAIDNTLFFDKEGNPWLFFVKFNDGNQIWSARLEEDLIHIIPGSEQKCLEMSQEWEKVWPSVNEGPFLLYHNGLYYLTYSANSFESPYYGIGYATAPSPEGPWTKFENNPVYQCVGSLEGVGHHSFFKDKSGKDRIVFHSHNAPGKIGPRIIHISDYNFKKDGTLVISPAYFTPWVE